MSNDFNSIYRVVYTSKKNCTYIKRCCLNKYTQTATEPFNFFFLNAFLVYLIVIYII